MYAVNKPVIDLRRFPVELLQDFSYDERRETQLLYAEPIQVLKSEKEWYYVYAPLQNYHGWVLKDEITPVSRPYLPNRVIYTQNATLQISGLTLPYGCLLEGNEQGQITLPDGQKDMLLHTREIKWNPQALLAETSLFLGTPYLWGGCSAPIPGTPCSVDCSGLIHLLFRAQGICLPRDAKDQAKVGYRVRKLKPLDALYLFHEGKQAHHVVLALTPSLCIHAPKSGQNISLLQWGQTIDWRGSLLWIEDREPAYCIIKRFSHRSYPISRAFLRKVR